MSGILLPLRIQRRVRVLVRLWQLMAKSAANVCKRDASPSTASVATGALTPAITEAGGLIEANNVKARFINFLDTIIANLKDVEEEKEGVLSDINDEDIYLPSNKKCLDTDPFPREKCPMADEFVNIQILSRINDVVQELDKDKAAHPTLHA